MVGNIARIVAQFKQSWSCELEDAAIERACEEAGHKWRDRKLGPVATVKMFFLQILFGNVACEFEPHLAGKDVTGSAYCTARGRFPLAALQTLLSRCTVKMVECVRDTDLWLGDRLFVHDGSFFDARHPRVVGTLLSAGRTGRGLRLSHGALAGVGPFWQRPFSEGDHGGFAHA